MGQVGFGFSNSISFFLFRKYIFEKPNNMIYQETQNFNLQKLQKQALLKDERGIFQKIIKK